MSLGTFLLIVLAAGIAYGFYYRFIRPRPVEIASDEVIRPRDREPILSRGESFDRFHRYEPRTPMAPQPPREPARPYNSPYVVRDYRGIAPMNARPGAAPVMYNGVHYWPTPMGGYVNSGGFTVSDALVLGALGLVAYELLHDRPAMAAQSGGYDPMVANPTPVGRYSDQPVVPVQPTDDVDLSRRPLDSANDSDVNLADGAQPDQPVRSAWEQPAPDVDLSRPAPTDRDADLSRPTSFDRDTSLDRAPEPTPRDISYERAPDPEPTRYESPSVDLSSGGGYDGGGGDSNSSDS